MDPRIRLGILVALLLGVLVYIFDEELIAFFADSDRHVDFAESLGITKAGKPTSGD
jgi:Na+-driven multidrug efflux pump